MRGTLSSGAVPPPVCMPIHSSRAEGITERVSDILLTCSGGTPMPAGQTIPRTTFQVTLSTNTSWSAARRGKVSEATLTIDEPHPGSGAVPDQTVVLPRWNRPREFLGARECTFVLKLVPADLPTHIRPNQTSSLANKPVLTRSLGLSRSILPGPLRITWSVLRICPLTLPSQTPPQSGWLDELGRLKGGWSVGLGVAHCAPYWLVQNCPPPPSAASCSRIRCGPVPVRTRRSIQRNRGPGSARP
jgi:hypothetical protein